MVKVICHYCRKECLAEEANIITLDDMTEVYMCNNCGDEYEKYYLSGEEIK